MPYLLCRVERIGVRLGLIVFEGCALDANMPAPKGG